MQEQRRESQSTPVRWIGAVIGAVTLVLWAPGAAWAQTTPGPPPYVGAPVLLAAPPYVGTPPYVGATILVGTPPYAGMPPAGGMQLVRSGAATSEIVVGRSEASAVDAVPVSASTVPLTKWDMIGLLAMLTAVVGVGGAAALRRQLR